LTARTPAAVAAPVLLRPTETRLDHLRAPAWPPVRPPVVAPRPEPVVVPAPAVAASPYSAALAIAPTGAYGPGARFAAAGVVAADTAPTQVRELLGRLARGTWAERGIGTGSGLVALAYLLPWGPVVVGSPDLGNVLQTLGVVGPWHIVGLLLALATAAGALTAPRAPGWLRFELAPLLTAGFGLGLVWPYVLGPLGDGRIGARLVFVGAAILLVTATLHLRAAHNAVRLSRV